MFFFLFLVLILDGILLMTVVLLQAGKGGGLAAMGGASTSTDSFIGGRQAATLLTRTTWVSGAVFLGLSVVLSIMSSRTAAPESILREEFQQTAPGAPQPVLPGLETEPQEGAQPTQPPAGDAGSTEPPPTP